ncbi:MAG TPA: DUF2892 domain-containing protein [Propionicimonas sp.]|jgi:uncharacterized membrane protein
MATPPAPAPKINITPTERISRVLVGAAGIVGGVLLLAGAHTTLAVVLELLLVLAGVDLLVTGARGHCPLYAKLGYVPASLTHRAQGGSS